MAWFLRAHQLDNGTIECRRGRALLDTHDNLEAAVAHLVDIAGELGNAIVFLHRSDGGVEEIARFGLDDAAT
jgi:hypothetical protein